LPAPMRPTSTIVFGTRNAKAPLIGQAGQTPGPSLKPHRRADRLPKT
jgi:hypothetical protein